MKLSVFKSKTTSHQESLIKSYRQLGEQLQNDIEWKNKYFTVCNWQNDTHFRLRYLMQACSQGIIVSEHQLSDNCFKGNIRPMSPCFHALCYYWFSFYPCASLGFIQYVWVIQYDLSQPFSKNKRPKNKWNQTWPKKPYYLTSSVHVNFAII